MTSRLRLGYPTRLLQGSLREKIPRVATFGANGIQLDLRNELRATELTDTGRRQLLHLASEHGLAIAPPVFPLRRALVEQEGLEARMAALNAALRFAATLGADVLIVRPGSLPAAGSGERPLFAELLNDLARSGDHVGVMPALTTGRDPVELLKEILEEVTAAPIGVNLDPAASVMAGHDPAETVRSLSGSLRHVRVRDGLREGDDAGLEVPVGRGEVDWESLLAALVEIGFGDWLTPDRTTGEDTARDAAQAISYVSNVMPF